MNIGVYPKALIMNKLVIMVAVPWGVRTLAPTRQQTADSDDG